MTVNRSKANDPRLWAKWKNSGAIETIADAVNRQMEVFDQKASDMFNQILARESGVQVEALGRNYENGYTTLSLSP